MSGESLAAARESLAGYSACLRELVALLDDARVAGESLRAAFRRAERALAGVPSLGEAERADPALRAELARAVELNAVLADLVRRRAEAAGTELARSRRARESLRSRAVPSSALGRLCDLAG